LPGGKSFTNKAAEEMRLRLTAMQTPRGTMVCTFHTLAVRLLREFSAQASPNRHFMTSGGPFERPWAFATWIARISLRSGCLRGLAN